MEVYGSGTSRVLKEITCSDCGHSYLIAQGQPSARCLQCGNIEYLPETTKHRAEKPSAVSKEIVSKREISSSSFVPAPDGHRVEEIRIRYQVEWQLWAVLVRNFQDPAYHMAYFCQVTATSQLEVAAQRYCDHRSVMALLSDSQWQAEVCELMLSRIENISVMRLNTDGGGWWSQLPNRFYLLRFDSPAMRIAWIALGMMAFVKIFSLVWWK